MKGVVLSGGQSSRMGTDKGLLRQPDGLWVEHPLGLFATLHIPAVISINAQQQETYRKILPEADFILDDDTLAVGGPLKGILSVHKAFPDDDLFVIACDMPLMQTNVLLNLQEAYSSGQQQPVYIFEYNGQPEPLCAIYTANALNTVYQWYQQQQLERFGLKYVLQKLNVSYIPLPGNWKIHFENCNAPDDIKKLPL